MKSLEVKKAVKDALDDKKMDDLSQQVRDLGLQIAKGFAEVHQRQDITNGKVLKNSSDILEMRSKDGYQKFIWLVVTTLIGVTVFFLTKG